MAITKNSRKSKIEQKSPQCRKTTNQNLRLGRHIQKVRKTAGITQEQLAEKVRKSVVWIELVESGHRIPNLKLLYKIARVLNVKVGDLFPF